MLGEAFMGIRGLGLSPWLPFRSPGKRGIKGPLWALNLILTDLKILVAF